MVLRFLALLILLLVAKSNLYSKENVGVIKNTKSNEKNGKQNIFEILESFGVNPVTVDYGSVVNWKEIEKLKGEEAELKIYKALKGFLKSNKITKIVISDDSRSFAQAFNSKESERRSRMTKAVADLERKNKVDVLAIAGGMDGVLYHNGVNISEIKTMISPKRAAKYESATRNLNMSGKQFCNAPTNKVLISKSSEMGRLMQLAEQKYNIKYGVNGENYVTEMQFSHSDAVSSEEENIDQLENAGFKVTGKSIDGLVFVVENKTNNDVLIAGHPILANIIRCPNVGSKEARIFARLLFCNLLNSRGQPKLPDNLLKFVK